ncbi:hypothetical protein DRP04_07205 [Archaeoglobales archaeon]|nr:MAG: hypothetical protein DRP04_07205 [Archaeoglobales archaeon]
MKQKQVEDGKTAFEKLKPVLDQGIIFLFAINPAYAYKWAINNNAYMIASALKKFEEAIRAERDREMIDYLKIFVPIGVLFFILAMAFYIVVMALHGGALPNPVSHPAPTHTPPPAHTPPKQVNI